MIFFDNEYVSDTQYKFNYTGMTEVTIQDYSEKLCGTIHKIYKSDNNVLLVYADEDFYTKDVYFCKEIGVNIFKVILDDPAKTFLALTRTAKKQVKTNKIL